ncbi:2Fe-2S iron-sulfur cluster binding domain-containing protein [Motilimonas sp. 1_MG-2023]|uniref:2Fe-2S iron-sulfur cluster binding domain-containing protein n=1 Tax=Motilimonas TaxID=1914248 RepID=UPI0026E3A2FC|nr:2Fe-2S iron-sulfur cluster binding domain-containing protein [Motilimonas sp. 1_MG-2023]MDO6526163.1 2Fe-2S iron-sulfur cluster binding domain-containing protein [Motilimonas sp. 1_MG-2023]
MKKIIFNGQTYPLDPSHSVLDNLLAAGLKIPHSCRTGICQSCILQKISGEVDSEAQQGLREALAMQDYFKTCCAFCDTDIEVTSGKRADFLGRAVITQKRLLNNKVCLLEIEPANPIYYHAGQFLNIRRDDGETRSYSIASLPSRAGALEFHIERMKNGTLSNWLFDEAQVGDCLEIQGPYGRSFYRTTPNNMNILLVANDCALAPALGVIRDALDSGFKGQVYLYHGSHNLDGLYFHEQLMTMDEAVDNFHYRACIDDQTRVRDELPAGYYQGNMAQLALSRFAHLQAFKVFLFGEPTMVRATKEAVITAGALIENVFIDPFDYRDLRKIKRPTKAA